jgi:hypothetical protein
MHFDVILSESMRRFDSLPRLMLQWSWAGKVSSAREADHEAHLCPGEDSARLEE